MIRLIALRLLGSALVVLFVASFGFLALRVAKGGPFDSEKKLPPEIEMNLRRSYGLDKPVAAQYFDYLKQLVRLDLGWSQKRPSVRVSDIIAESFPVSVKLGLLSLGFALFFGVLLGVTAATHHNRWPDHLAMLVALGGISVPAFVLGPLLIIAFALELMWLPAARFEGFSSMILPAMTLGLIFMGTIARLSRAGMLETIRQDYVRTARAKGLGEQTVTWKHALRLGVVPVVTYLGPAIASLITGSIVIERIFQIPGLGSYIVGSVVDRDYTTLTGVMVFYCLCLILLNLAVDIAYGFLDPRIREAR
ncbi:MAG: ABC transporter permease [Deltaproteobacteria bacterium]|nr:ABC transporter permease [Deltaproteobacteria bacterium]